MTTEPVTPAASPVPCSAVVGLQWGDEGKGKVVDMLAGRFDAVVRYNGGANAGHSVVVAGQRYALHLIPSGILYPGKLAVIACGVVIDIEVVLKEIEGLKSRGVDTSGLVISDRAHVVMPYHKLEDELRENRLSQFFTQNAEPGAEPAAAAAGNRAPGSLGTTKRGIGPAYADKAQRGTAIRVGDLIRPDVLRRKIRVACALKNPMLRGLGAAGDLDPDGLYAAAVELGRKIEPCVRDTTYLLHDLRGAGRRILFEGANAALLDVDHGTYPFVTSSSCTALGIPAGTGIPGTALGQVIGVVKAYSTRVGNGPLVTELVDAVGDGIRQRGREFGTTTGRPRRVGWLDLVAVKYSAMLSGATSLALTLLDVLAGVDELQVCTAYTLEGDTTTRFPPDADTLERCKPVYQPLPGFRDDISACRRRDELPRSALRYLDLIERHVGVPIGLIGVGPGREQTIVCTP
jgi:adenylosuccinate synthase